MSSAVRDDTALIRRLLGYLRPYRSWAVASVILLLAHSALGIVGPLLTKIAVDHSLRPIPLQESWLDAWLPADRAAALATLVVIYSLVLVLNYILRATQIQVMNRTGQSVMFDIRNETFQRLQSKSVSYLSSTPVGKLVTRVTSDVDALNELFTSGIAAIAGDVVTLVFILGAMLYLSVKLTLVLMTVGPLILLVTWLFRSRVRISMRKVRGAVADINSFLQERLSGISVIQLFGGEQRALAEFDEINQTHRDAQLAATRAHSLFFPAIELLGVVAIIVLLLGGGWLYADGALSLGVLVAFLQFGARIFRPVQDLSEKFNVLQSAMAGSERIFSLLDLPVDEAPSSGSSAAEPLESPTIEFDQVWFSYNDEDWVLRDVSFRVEPYEMMAVVGHTGAGKTTLISLLLRFYAPQRGRILVGGKDIREWSREDLRKQFGVVLQDPHLFNGTIDQNIRLGDVTQEQARQAAGRVQLSTFIEALPQGFETEIGERGAALSGGQKQLLGFARALARKAPFLILDEATSSVDPATDLLIRDALAQLVDKHTSIVIAHRLSTVKSASRVLVMHKGKLREIGTHAELIAQRGLYWKLYQLQYQSQERIAQTDG